MKIAVYGATGMVGSQVVAEARARGHDVSGFSRSGGAGVTAADLGDTETFREVARDNDAVVVAIPPDRTGGSHEPVRRAFEGIVRPRPAARVLVVVGAGSLEVDGVALSDTPGFPEGLKPEAVTMGAVLDMLRTAEGLDWTAVSPSPVLRPGERTGEYRTGTDSPAGEEVSPEDLAVAIVDELESPRFRGVRFTVAS